MEQMSETTSDVSERESGSGEREESKRRAVAARTGRRVVHTREALRVYLRRIVRAPLHLIARLCGVRLIVRLGHIVGHIVDAGACQESRTRMRKWGNVSEGQSGFF